MEWSKFTRLIYLCAAFFLGGVFWLPDRPVTAGETHSPPSYNSSRYLEDYRYLKDPARRTDFWDPIKYIPLDDAGTVYLSLGGETRQHYESIRNENWGATTEDNNGWYLQRYLLHADLHVGDRLRLFSQIQSGIETGRSGGPRGVDEDRLDLNQLFMDFSLLSSQNQNLSIRIGRQEIIFGSRRFFNYRERPNLRLSHDAVKLMAKAGTDVGWTFPQKLDAYYIGLNREQARFDQSTANEVRHSIGTRFSGKRGGLDYNFEFMYQFGSFGDGTISAYAVASDTGFTWELGGDSKIRFSLRADIYSGDDDPNDADLNSFNPFFPKGKHISQLAATGLINQRDLHPKINIQFNKSWFLTLSTEFIWRDSLDDGIYSIGNGLLKTGQASRARYVGTQPEVELKWQVDRHLDIKGIFIFFDAGPFIRETPPGNDIVYLGTMATYRF
jgi:hypothetical protein